MGVSAVIFHNSGKVHQDNELLSLMNRVENELFLDYLKKLLQIPEIDKVFAVTSVKDHKKLREDLEKLQKLPQQQPQHPRQQQHPRQPQQPEPPQHSKQQHSKQLQQSKQQQSHQSQSQSQSQQAQSQRDQRDQSARSAQHCRTTQLIQSAQPQTQLEIINSEQEGSFHLGKTLQKLVTDYELDRVLVSGGTALPLMETWELGRYIRELQDRDDFMITNNPQSGDLILFHPARLVNEIPQFASDNELSNNLRYQAGLPQKLMDKSTAPLFDIDTPVDLLLYYQLTGKPSWLMEEYGHLFARLQNKLEEVSRIAATDYRELILAGRVSGNIISYINEHLRVRLRIFSEERGMKALKRIQERKVSSFMGNLLEDLGPQGLFSYLEKVGEAALIDTRVMFYHMKRGLPDQQGADLDRFYSDLFLYEYVQDPVIKEFTKCGYQSSMPLLMGGHSLVSGGIYALTSLIYRS
ncbi:hypothetical protein [Natranaerobius thermophilus]|uniref:Uncharacterized protein n=1 Tax=Natranaerobius thermophilus (strain ATCC BAA-1301 / DSM 18059 / JW/NM-WN-LF) TaxID=457570 RepID=B2A814_NATTJ|nr:hypothetical protein [Natranaerobius thermophilus]ACB85786.1 hypothetical protein Nther_2220 [Natranaerobius thermophilus JW/NM-WN-LF]